MACAVRPEIPRVLDLPDQDIIVAGRDLLFHNNLRAPSEGPDHVELTSAAYEREQRLKAAAGRPGYCRLARSG